MGAKEKAAVLHQSGFNCAQSVLGALAGYTDWEEKALLAAAGGFGGGVSCGEICGAASGAVMAFGLAFAGENPADPEARMKVRRLTAEFNRRFRETFGCIRCADLKRSGHPCPELIAWAAETAENIIEENKY